MLQRSASVQLLSLRREGLEDIGTWPQARFREITARIVGSEHHDLLSGRCNTSSSDLGSSHFQQVFKTTGRGSKTLAPAPLCSTIPSSSVQVGCRSALIGYADPGSETWAICCSAAAKSLGRRAQQTCFHPAWCTVYCLPSNPSFSGSC